MGIDCRTLTGLGETETRGRLNQTYLLVLEGLLQRQGVALFHCQDKDTGSGGSGKYSLA